MHSKPAVFLSTFTNIIIFINPRLRRLFKYYSERLLHTCCKLYFSVCDLWLTYKPRQTEIRKHGDSCRATGDQWRRQAIYCRPIGLLLQRANKVHYITARLKSGVNIGRGDAICRRVIGVSVRACFFAIDAATAGGAKFTLLYIDMDRSGRDVTNGDVTR